MPIRIHGDKIEFPDGTKQFTASTGSGGSGDAYTKEEVDASQKAQDDAIEAIQKEFATFVPHDYLYVNNCVESPEEGTNWETFVAPQPGEVFFMGPGGMPVPNDSYEVIESVYISKYDKEGKELPFNLEDFAAKIIKFASPNGSASFPIYNLISSDIAPEHIGYEGDTFFIISVDVHEEGYQYTGTITEGQTAQVTSPEEGQVIAEWEATEYVSTENPLDIITSANIKTDQIVVNKLAISSTWNRGEKAVSNIMIGNEPNPMMPWWADDYMPGLHWNTSTSEGNIAIGQDALKSAENVIQNVAIGQDSLGTLRNGWCNTAIGFQAGTNLTGGSHNTFIGYGARPRGGSENVSGQVALGGDDTQELWVGNNKVFPFPDDLGGGSGGGSGDAYTKAEVDASQKSQNDAIEEIQKEIAPKFPHGYVYVNNSVESSEEGKVWETFVPPKPGEMFFLAEYLAPVPDGNYASAKQLFVSKYDNKGNELPFQTREIYNEETGELELTLYEVYLKELKLVSPNGSATYTMEMLVPSTEAPEHIEYEGETFYIIQIDTYENPPVAEGTIAEGEIVQITSPEEGVVLAEWKAKEYVHPDDPNYVISSANSETNQIVVDKLAISSSYTGAGEDTAVTNIVIGTEPNPKKPWYAGEIMPGVPWNSSSKGNIAIGHRALGGAEDITHTIAVGTEALLGLRNGWSNIAIGDGAGDNLRSGDNNIFIGHDAGPAGGTEDVRGQVVLGNRFADQLWVGDNKVFPFPDDLGGVWEEVGSGFGRAAVTQVYGLGIGTDYPYKPSGRTLQVEADGPTRLILNNTKANMMVIKADDPAADSSNQGGGIVISDYTGTNEAGAEPIARFNSNGVFVEKDLSANRILVGSGNGNWTNTRIGSNTFKDMDDSAVHNTAVGRQALLSVTNGIDNVAVGSGALQWTREGSKNVGIGHEAGLNITTGINNTCIGYAAQPSDPKVSNEVTIGNDDVTATRLKGTVTANGTPLTTTVDVDTAIDKKLAIKDKLIEKLSKRLDDLEKRIK